MSEPKKPYRAHLFICQGKKCVAKSNPEEAKAFFKGKIKEQGLKDELRACLSSCLDRCEDAPNMVIYPEATWLSHVSEKDWPAVFERLAQAKTKS